MYLYIIIKNQRHMKEKKLGQEPVFPATTDHMIDQYVENGVSPEGISKRLYIATKIVSAIASSGRLVVADYSFKDAVDDAYYVTDLLLENE